MLIGKRLRKARELLNMSQGDVEKRTGLMRSYISRIENGHSEPALETLEKLARAFDIPLYELLYEGDQPPKPLPVSHPENLWGNSGKDAHFLFMLRGLLAEMREEDRKLLLSLTGKMLRKKPRAKHKTRKP
jgi:transcriptional regulator with XRE-family HTH domain